MTFRFVAVALVAFTLATWVRKHATLWEAREPSIEHMIQTLNDCRDDRQENQ